MYQCWLGSWGFLRMRSSRKGFVGCSLACNNAAQTRIRQTVCYSHSRHAGARWSLLPNPPAPAAPQQPALAMTSRKFPPCRCAAGTGGTQEEKGGGARGWGLVVNKQQNQATCPSVQEYICLSREHQRHLKLLTFWVVENQAATQMADFTPPVWGCSSLV